MTAEIAEKKNKRKAAVSTALICALVVFLLLIFSFKIVDPNESNPGVEVALGEPYYGGPDKTPPATSTYTPPSESESTESMITSDQEDAVPMKEEKKETKKKEVTPKQETKEPEPEKPKEPEMDKALRDAMERAKQSKESGQGSGDGTTTGTQGSKDGTDGKSGGDGTGGDGSGGTGSGFDVSGLGSRKIVARPPMTTKCSNAKGTLKIEITVASDGTVTNATVARGSTYSDVCLAEDAIDKAKKFRFESSGTAGVSKGYITFYFK